MRQLAPLAACFALAAPADASAHARTATVAPDYRLVLDRRTVGGAAVRILDGDRSLQLTAGASPLVVLGDLGEPMLRLDRSGAYASRASATAVSERLVSEGGGWRRVGGTTFAWHDHRLAPPPYDGGRSGPAARFRVPLLVAGGRTAITGAFVRYPRPAAWPWLAGAAVSLAAAFGAADSPTRRTAWLEPALAAFVALAAAISLVRLLLAALIAAVTGLASTGARA